MAPGTRRTARTLQPFDVVWTQLRVVVELDVEVILDVLLKAEFVVDKVGRYGRRNAHQTLLRDQGTMRGMRAGPCAMVVHGERRIHLCELIDVMVMW